MTKNTPSPATSDGLKPCAPANACALDRLGQERQQCGSEQRPGRKTDEVRQDAGAVRFGYPEEGDGKSRTGHASEGGTHV